MKLRIARKIMKAVGTPDQDRYSDHQIDKANRRYSRTRSTKEADRFWHEEIVPLFASTRGDW